MPGWVVSSPPAASAQPGSRRNLSLGCYGHQRFLQLFMEKKAVGEQILHRVMSSGGKKKIKGKKKTTLKSSIPHRNFLLTRELLFGPSTLC